MRVVREEVLDAHRLEGGAEQQLAWVRVRVRARVRVRVRARVRVRVRVRDRVRVRVRVRVGVRVRVRVRVSRVRVRQQLAVGGDRGETRAAEQRRGSLSVRTRLG